MTIYYYSHSVTQKAIGEMYGVPTTTVNSIVNNPKWMKKARDYLDKEMDRAEIIKNMALLKAMRATPDAMDQIIKIASQKVTSSNMNVQYVIQNACNEILNRAGVKAQNTDTNEVVIKFADPAAAFEPGMPELEASGRIDVTDSMEQSSDAT